MNLGKAKRQLRMVLGRERKRERERESGERKRERGGVKERER